MLNLNFMTFTSEIQEIEEKLLMMGEWVQQEYQQAVTSIFSTSGKFTEIIYELDKKVDQHDAETERSVLQLIMMQPPLPRELEALTATLRISRELERVGDYAVNIMEIGEKVSSRTVFQEEIIEMSSFVEKMLTDCMVSLKNKNVEQAAKIEKLDDTIDQLYEQLQRKLITEMKRNPSQAEQLANLHLMNRYIERSADHVVNISRLVKKMMY